MPRKHISVANLYIVAVVRVLRGYVPTQLQKGFKGKVVHTAVSNRTHMKACVFMRFHDMSVSTI